MNRQKFVFLVIFFSFFLPLVSAFNFETNDISITTTTITGNLTHFTNLIDTPADYTGDGGNCVKVNVGETGLTFSACAGGGDFSFSDFADAFNSNASVYVFSTYNSTYASYGSFNTTANIETLYNATALAIAQANGGNASWNESYANTLYALIGTASKNTTGTNYLFNDTYTIYFNDTFLNLTIGDYISNISSGGGDFYLANFSVAFQNNISAWEALVNASYLTTYNSTYALYAYNHTIETFNLYNSTWSYGLNPFNQSLNTTDDVTFNKLNVSGFDSLGNNNIIGSYFIKWLDSGGTTPYGYTMANPAGYVIAATGVPLIFQYGNLGSLIGAYMNESGYWNFTQPAHFNNVNPLTTLTYDLGSGAERWNWLYVRNISTEYLDVLNALSFDGNITAGYIFANGSELTSVCLQNGSNCVASGGDYYLANYSGSFQTNITDWETKVNDSYLSIFNITYNNLLNQQCPSGQVLNGTYSNGTFSCISVTSLGGDYYLANFSGDFQRNITDWETRVNNSYLTTYNVTYDDFINNESNLNVNSSVYWNGTLTGFNDTQMEDNNGILNILESWILSLVGMETEPAWNGNYTIFIGLINNDSYLTTYNATYELWAYNHTTETFNLYNSTWDNRGDIISNITALNGRFSNFNQSNFQTSFNLNSSYLLNKSEFATAFGNNLSSLGNNWINFSEFQASFNLNATPYLTRVDAQNHINWTNTNNFINYSEFATAFTNNLSQIAYGNFNISQFQSSFNSNSTYLLNRTELWTTGFNSTGDTRWSGNASWNQSYATTLYVGKSDSSNFMNITQFQSSFNLNSSYLLNKTTAYGNFNFSNFQPSFNLNSSYLFNRSEFSNAFQVNITAWEAKVNATYLSLGSWLAGATTIYNVTANIGIGTATPTHKLNVVGTSNFTENLLVDGVNAITLKLNDGSARPVIVMNDKTGGGEIAAITGTDTGAFDLGIGADFAGAKGYDASLKIFGDGDAYANYIQLTHTGASGYGSIGTDTGDLVLSPAGGINFTRNTTFTAGSSLLVMTDQMAFRAVAPYSDAGLGFFLTGGGRYAFTNATGGEIFNLTVGGGATNGRLTTAGNIKTGGVFVDSAGNTGITSQKWWVCDAGGTSIGTLTFSGGIAIAQGC